MKTDKPVHTWLKRLSVAFVPGPMTPLLEIAVQGLARALAALGHTVQDAPAQSTDVLISTAQAGEPVDWRDSLLLTGRRRFHLRHTPTVYTLMHMTRESLDHHLSHFAHALAKEPPDPEDFSFPGLASTAWQVLVEQGRRGGPMLSLERLLQAQAKAIRIILFIGDQAPEEAYSFDLVGAYPRSHARDIEAFYQDLALGIVTAVSSGEMRNHAPLDPPIPLAVWQRLETPQAMARASQELGQRHFFTRMIRIADLVHVPTVDEAVSSQYSEGCFATWDPQLQALVATVTGSARPVDKGQIKDDDLVILAGLRPNGEGVWIRQVAGKANYPPSSEAVELVDMDGALPRIAPPPDIPSEGPVPVIRSKLHGHRGIARYDPRYVEFVPLSPPYYYYLVSCGTAAQARGIKEAFSRSQALRNPEDPRQIVFTVLPGHGIMLAEKWMAGKVPFQLIWEAMDDGRIIIDAHIPQGPMIYVPDDAGNMIVRELSREDPLP